jgi:dihydroxyacetone kinase-like protein
VRDAAAPDGPLAAAIDAARDGVERTRDLVSQRGRAAWVGERTAGHADGGATAWVRILEAVETELDRG